MALARSQRMPYADFGNVGENGYGTGVALAVGQIVQLNVSGGSTSLRDLRVPNGIASHAFASTRRSSMMMRFLGLGFMLA